MPPKSESQQEEVGGGGGGLAVDTAVETTSLLAKHGRFPGKKTNGVVAVDEEFIRFTVTKKAARRALAVSLFVILISAFLVGLKGVSSPRHGGGGGGGAGAGGTRAKNQANVGPYKLLERHVGDDFFSFYDFYDGPDSEGSAGYIVYVGPQDRARALGLANVTVETVPGSKESGGGNETNGTSSSSSSSEQQTFVYLQSKATEEGPRQSVRLEGKRRFDRGLFVLDLDHMPVGCGVWPAWWLTDEDAWPDHGEIDIVEGVNYQTVAKTALHTREGCSMFAHVPSWSRTGEWDRATCLPDTYTGETNCETSKEADDCWEFAAHQWFNQGCVTVDRRNGTIGAPLNEKGGGVYALEWDPERKYIRSWVFTPRGAIPENLKSALASTSEGSSDQTLPDPDTWGSPYAYFAIGDGTGCSDDHFQNMHLVLNLAFCGTVAGNRYFGDCPASITDKFNANYDPVWSCNAYIQSNPDELNDAYWKIRGVYVYEREMAPINSTSS